MSDADPPPSTTSRQAPTTPAGQLNPGIFTQGALAGSVSGATNVGLQHPPQSHLSALRTVAAAEVLRIAAAAHSEFQQRQQHDQEEVSRVRDTG